MAGKQDAKIAVRLDVRVDGVNVEFLSVSTANILYNEKCDSYRTYLLSANGESCQLFNVF